MTMKGLLLVCLFAFADARLKAALSILPDLAFFFDGSNSSLYDVNGTAFKKLSTLSESVFFNNIPPGINASAYILTDDGNKTVTAFFKGADVYVTHGNEVTKMNSQLRDLYTGGPAEVEAAFHIVDKGGLVKGTSYILGEDLFECGSVGGSCEMSKLSTFAQFNNFLHDGEQIDAALGLSSGAVVLFKENKYAIIKERGGKAEEHSSYFDDAS